MSETFRRQKVKSFEIVLEHDIDEQYQYVPGEMMKGVVVVTCEQPITVQQILITLQGEGNVIWEQQKAVKGLNKFKSHEIYLDHTENVIQSAAVSGSIELEVGVNEFPFYCQLSDSLPSSYIGKYGSVTYLIKAQLRPDRKFAADAMITNEPFLVLRRYDLSLEPNTLQPYEVSHTQRIGAACLCGGKVTAFVKINRRSFTPGEDLKLNVDVTNGSSLEITSLEAAIIMVSRFSASSSFIQNYQTISKHADQYAIEKGEGRRWNDIRLTIPPYIPESGLEGCDIIHLAYMLVFKVQMNYNPKHKDNLALEIPLTIGTHGVNLNEDLEDDPTLRPLYHRQGPASLNGIQLPLASTNQEEDDVLGEIDHSLFEKGSAEELLCPGQPAADIALLLLIVPCDSYMRKQNAAMSS
ncbi:hypothetical protein EB796_014913 [Bugula neritina]|uniref:Arrestin C-terminal-like domain-containing protein n=1 Tax=Bugula neritina TaxID=10212 RepID=A0A7J7JKA2_BUGNE|nr:hypothetical protein EB796_014913 [Bugula neritina]